MKLTLAQVEEMVKKAGGPFGQPKEFRGSPAAVRCLYRLLVTGQVPPPRMMEGRTRICGFDVVVDPRCPPGMLYFGRTEDFV